MSEEIMAKLADHLLDQSEGPPEVMHTRFMELMALVSRAVIDAGGPSSEILDLSHRQVGALALLRTRPEIHSWALNCLSALMSKIRAVDYSDRVLERAVEYIRENHNRPELEFKDVARAVHLSPSHLSHLFKEKMGVSFVKYLTRLRVEEAKKLLRTTDATVVAVATTVGYEDPSYFHRIFRRQTGMTPTTYRKLAH